MKKKVKIKQFKQLITFALVANSAYSVNSRFGDISINARAGVDFDSNIFSNETESDDVVITFTPTATYARQFGPLKLSATGGGNFGRYIDHPEEDFSDPITSFNIGMAEDFGIFSVNKRSAGKIKFGFDTDVSQRTESNQQLQDLVSYTLYTANFNVRYNHSPKFGVSAQAKYDFRDYQDISSIQKYYTDMLTRQVGATLYYIYSPKLDLYADYNFSKHYGKSEEGRNFFTNNDVSTIRIGAEGTFTPKISGDASIGYAFRTFDNSVSEAEEGIIFSTSVTWQFRQKTGVSIGLTKNYMPTSQDNALDTSSYHVSLTHKFTSRMIGTAGYIYNNSDYLTYRTDPRDPAIINSSLINPSDVIFDRTDVMQGINLSVNNAITKYLSTVARYTYSTTDSGYGDDFSNERHVLSFTVNLNY